MHRTLAEIVERIEADRAALMLASQSLTQTQLDFRPSPDRWSVSENLDHLAKVEKGIARLLQVKSADAVRTSTNSGAPRVSYLTSLDKFQIAINPRNMKVPDPKIEPQHGKAKDELLANLEATRSGLRASLDLLAECDLSLHTFPHPAFGDINLYQWILFIGHHERRHLNQIKAILADENFPAASPASV